MRLFPSDRVGLGKLRPAAPGWSRVTEHRALAWQSLREAYGTEQMGQAQAPQARTIKAKAEQGRKLGEKQGNRSGIGSQSQAWDRLNPAVDKQKEEASPWLSSWSGRLLSWDAHPRVSSKGPEGSPQGTWKQPTGVKAASVARGPFLSPVLCGPVRIPLSNPL